MKWPYFIKQKLKTALALAVVFLLVLCTNLLDKMHFDELHETINSVHKDRLLVENYVYNISTKLNKKRVAIYELTLNNDSTQSLNSFASLNNGIMSNINDFRKTVLTDEEDSILTALSRDIIKLELMEEEFLSDNPSVASSDVLNFHDSLNSKLQRLSEIQLEEGEKMLESSNSIISISNLSSRLEITILIIIGLIIQVIIVSSKSLQSKFPQQSNLN